MILSDSNLKSVIYKLNDHVRHQVNDNLWSQDQCKLHDDTVWYDIQRPVWFQSWHPVRPLVHTPLNKIWDTM